MHESQERTAEPGTGQRGAHDVGVVLQEIEEEARLRGSGTEEVDHRPTALIHQRAESGEVALRKTRKSVAHALVLRKHVIGALRGHRVEARPMSTKVLIADRPKRRTFAGHSEGTGDRSTLFDASVVGRRTQVADDAGIDEDRFERRTPFRDGIRFRHAVETVEIDHLPDAAEKNHGGIEQPHFHPGESTFGIHDEAHPVARIHVAPLEMEQGSEPSDCERGGRGHPARAQIAFDPCVAAPRDRPFFGDRHRHSTQVIREVSGRSKGFADRPFQAPREVAGTHADASVVTSTERETQTGTGRHSQNEPVLMVGVRPEGADAIRGFGDEESIPGPPNGFEPLYDGFGHGVQGWTPDAPRASPMLRLFLSLLSVVALAAAQAATGIPAFDAAAAEHLLNRAGFGAGPEEIAEAVARGRAATVERLLDVPYGAKDAPRFERRPIPPRTSRKAVADTRPSLGKEEIDKIVQKSNNDAEAADLKQLHDFRSWWVERMIRSEAPLREKVTLFWAGHFTSSQRDVRNSLHMVMQNEFLRDEALGSFRTLLHGIAKDPAMLRYLDNNRNRKGKPNENFAREVMELFSLGEGNYGENDVKEAARAFTGWNFRDDRFVLDAANHDFGEKTLFGRTGRFGGEHVIDLLLEHPASTRFVAGRLLGFFVHHAPPTEMVDRYADLLRKHDWNIAPVLRALFNDPEFYRPEFVGSRILGPIEFGVASARRMPGDRKAPGWLLAFAADGMGQSLLAPPNVRGWEGGDAWMTSSSLLARGNLALAMCDGFDARSASTLGLGGSADATNRIVAALRAGGAKEWRPEIPVGRWIRDAGLKAPEDVVDALCDRFLGVRVSEASRDTLLAYAFDVLPPDWDAPKMTKDADRRLARLLHLVLSLPEAQLG